MVIKWENVGDLENRSLNRWSHTEVRLYNKWEPHALTAFNNCSKKSQNCTFSLQEESGQNAHVTPTNGTTQRQKTLDISHFHLPTARFSGFFPGLCIRLQHDPKRASVLNKYDKRMVD